MIVCMYRLYMHMFVHVHGMSMVVAKKLLH